MWGHLYEAHSGWTCCWSTAVSYNSPTLIKHSLMFHYSSIKNTEQHQKTQNLSVSVKTHHLANISTDESKGNPRLASLCDDNQWKNRFYFIFLNETKLHSDIHYIIYSIMFLTILTHLFIMPQETLLLKVCSYAEGIYT